MLNFFKQKNKGHVHRLSKVSGFTLVETLVAISIFTLSVLALMVILGNGLSDTNFAKQKITATYLAQEGIEYMRNMRDTHVLYDENNLGWTEFLAKINPCNMETGPNAKGCYFRDDQLDFSAQDRPILNIDVLPCIETNFPDCPELRYVSTEGAYSHDPLVGEPAGFWRKISYYDTESIGGLDENIDEIKVISTVYWRQGSGNHSISFSANLFNWTKNQ